MRRAASGDTDARLELWVSVVHPLGVQCAEGMPHLTPGDIETALTGVFFDVVLRLRAESLPWLGAAGETQGDGSAHEMERRCRGWLRVCLRRALLAKGRVPTVVLEDGVGEAADPDGAPERLVTAQEAVRVMGDAAVVIHAAMEQLSAHDQTLLRLRAARGASYREIAETLGITEATARQRFRRLIPRVADRAVALARLAGLDDVADYLRDPSLLSSD